MAGLVGDALSRLVLGPAMSAFASLVTHYPQGGVPVARRGVFTADHTLIGADGQVDFSTTAPTLGIRDAEWPLLPRMNDRILIGAALYEIQDVQPDGPNIGRTLILRRCSQNPAGRASSRIDAQSRVVGSDETIG